MKLQKIDELKAFVKYPVNELVSKKYNLGFYESNKITKRKGLSNSYYIVYFEYIETNNKVNYPKSNPLGVYCKTIDYIQRFKGNFNIELCSKLERIQVARDWYVKNSVKLPRKIKKMLIAKQKQYL